MKTCSKCKLKLALDQFHKSSRHSGGLYPRCKSCVREDKKEIKDRMSPERLARWRQQSKDWRAANPEKRKHQYRKDQLKAYYGLTIEQYDELLAKQGGVCASCSRPPTDKNMAVDHNHACCPGRKSCGRCIRGLLCSNCNTALGLLGESPEKIMNLLKYLEGS